MKINLRNKNFLYIGIILFLTVTYILSFLPVFSSHDKRQYMETELVNQKYRNSITEIQLTKASGDSIVLRKINDYWTLNKTNLITNVQSSIPADSVLVENFITDLITFRRMYKISDGKKPAKTFGFDSNEAFSIRYTINNENSQELIFGSQDFALSSRYLMTGKSVSVYEIDNSLDKYLTTSVQYWGEPYLISQNVLGRISFSDVQSITVSEGLSSKVTVKTSENDSEFLTKVDKLLQLRHGGMNELSTLDSDLNAVIELGNKNTVELNFVQLSDDSGDYEVSVTYTNNLNNQKPVTYYSRISYWTYNKIKEIIL